MDPHLDAVSCSIRVECEALTHPPLFSYTFFIVLYPLGASGEVITMLSALAEIGRKKHFTVEMPNAVNFGFSFYYFVIALCLIYIPGFPQLYGYMFTQRKKVLSVDKPKKAS